MELEPNSIKVTTESEYDEIKYDESKEILIMGSIHAPEFKVEDEKQRKPVDLVAVVDISGSMQTTLPLVKDSLLFMIEQLQPKDRFSLVTYHTNVNVDISLTDMSHTNKELAVKVIESLAAKDMTNLSGGLFMGIQQIAERKEKHDVASVLLFTDGQANQGITEVVPLVEETTKRLAVIGDACSVFTFGFGAGHSEGLLRKIADSCNGMYYFMEKKDDIPDAFADTLGGLLSVVAQNVNITISPFNGVEILKVMTKYPAQKSPSGVYTIKISDLYGEERRDIILSAKIPAINEPTDHFEVLNFTCDCFNLLTSNMITRSVKSAVKRPKDVVNAKPNYSLDRQKNRIISGEALEKARALGDNDKMDEAKEILRKAIATLENSASADDVMVKEFIKDMNEAINDMVDRASYHDFGGKKMAMREQKMSKQRAAGKEYGETTYKAKMRAGYEDRKTQQAAAKTQKPTTTQHTTPTANTKTLLVGNKHSLVPEDQVTESTSTPGEKNSHEWTLYCRGTDVSFIEKVVFTIHSTFNPNVITVASAPFEITRRGWGIFEAKLTIHFKPGHGRTDPLEVTHFLSFSQDDTYQEVIVNL